MALMSPPSTIAVVLFFVSFMSHGVCGQPPDASQMPALNDLKTAWHVFGGGYGGGGGGSYLDTWNSSNRCSDWVGLTCDNSSFVTSINVSYSGTFGYVPASIGSLAKLTTLRLKNNHFVGDLPDVFDTLTSIQTLDLSGNQFRGKLPTSLSALTNAKYISFSYNRFAGSLDASLGQLSSLQTLNMDNNIFVGTIPTTLTSLGQLTSLTLNSNFLKGDTVTLQAMQALHPSLSMNIDQNCFSNVNNQKDAPTCGLSAYGVTLAAQTSACGGTSTATLNGTPVVGRYYFFSVSVGSIYTRSGTQPNNAIITITHSVTGLPGYNGPVNLDGAVITFTNSVSTPTLIHSGGHWLLSLPNNDATWKIPVFGGGSLVRVLDPSPSNLSYSFSMTSNSVDVLGAAWLLSMVQYNTPIVASPPLPVESDYNYLQITPKDLLTRLPYIGYFSGQPTTPSEVVNFPYPGNFNSFNPTYSAMYDTCIV